MPDPYDYGPDHAPQVEDNQMEQLSTLVDYMEAAEREVEGVEENLKRAKREVRRYAEDLIPGLMAQFGIKTITTSSGVVVSLKTTYRATPTVANRETAWQWLEDNGHGGLLKRTLAVAFSKGEEEKVADLRLRLEAEYSTVKEDRGVHPSTLKAFAKEMVESGQDIPFDIFGIEVIESAKVKRSTF